MIIDLGLLGEVEMSRLDSVRYEQGYVTHSGYTEQGIRIHLYRGVGWQHGEMWNNAIMLDYYEVVC